MPCSLLLAATAAVAPAVQTDERRFPSHRFAIAAPGAGWSVDDGVDTAEGFRVDVRLEGAQGLVAASVLCGDVGGDVDAAAALAAALSRLEGRDEYVDHEPVDGLELDGRPAPGVDVAWEAAGGLGRFRIRMHYVVSDGRAYLLQVHAPRDGWDEHGDAFDRFFASFRLVEPTGDDALELAVRDLAARCGSEVDWVEDWGTAASRARETGRLVLVVVRSYPGFDLPDSTRFSTFLDEDVLALVRERLVALRLEKGMDAPFRDPAIYGLSPSTFGVALLLVDPDGSVLADTPHTEADVAFRWLARELARHGAGPPAADLADPVERATHLLDRGELDAASVVLDATDDPRAHRVRARLARLRHDGPAALAALAAAREAEPGAALEIACEKAEVLVREGRDADARRALRPVLLSPPDAPERPEAYALMALLDQREFGLATARLWRERLVLDHADSRSSWFAAAALRYEALLEAAGAGESDGGTGWPRPEVLAVLVEPEPAPLHASRAAGAADEAAAWLLAHQRDDGSWPSRTELNRADDDAPEPMATAIDALAASALLPRGEVGRDAAAHALRFLLEADARRRADPDPVVYMDYTAWAVWAQLELVADALAADVGDAGELHAFAARLVGDVRDRVRANGGWSYYVSGDAAGENPSEQSISFTTAAVVVGLVRAREAGIEVPDGLLAGALDCLEAMRDDAGLYAYMLHHPSGRATRSGAPGAAGRGPACEFALLLGDRVGAERLRGAMELFERHSHALAGEVGKALMHAGADTQGCHYPLFDYLMAARATTRLPGGERRAFRAHVLERVLETRLADGSFQDTPVIGRTFGTAAALLALDELDE